MHIKFQYKIYSYKKKRLHALLKHLSQWDMVLLSTLINSVQEIVTLMAITPLSGALLSLVWTGDLCFHSLFLDYYD